MSAGYVYVLSNPSAQGMLKIGFSKHGGKHRADSFYKGGTGLPTPYQLEFELHVPDARQVERNVHLSLDEYRVNTRREWFQCLVGQAITEILRYGTPDFDVEVLQWPDHLDIRGVWSVFNNGHNKSLIARGYYPVTQEQYAASAYRLIHDFDLIEQRVLLARDPSHTPTEDDRQKSRLLLKGLMEMFDDE